MGIRQGVLIGVGIVIAFCGIGFAVLSLMAGGATVLAREATKDGHSEAERIRAHTAAEKAETDAKIRRIEAETGP